jgi:uncharacterized protein YuzE
MIFRYFPETDMLYIELMSGVSIVNLIFNKGAVTEV